jgi:hypothetical protein
MQANEIYNLFYFQVNGNLEDTYVSSNCAYYSHNTLNVKVALNNILTNQFQIYLYLLLLY